MDISEGGAFLVVPARVELDTAVSLRFSHQDTNVCEAAGRVVRKLPFGAHATGFAVAFDTLSDGMRAFLGVLESTPEAQRRHVLAALSEVHVRLS